MGLLSSRAHLMSSLQNSQGRPAAQGVLVYALCFLLGYGSADLMVLNLRPKMLPNQAPPARPQRDATRMEDSAANLNIIRERNIFSETGVIPPPLTEEGQQNQNDDGPAIASQLPLGLEGTIVHGNPARSIATITLRNRNETMAFAIDDEIEGLARIMKIERRKVIFRNLNNNRLEFIEIPPDSKIVFGMKAPPVEANSEVVKRGEFDFQVRREDIKKYTADLAGILNQARMVPNIVPGAGGRIDGFRFVSIQPGSIYEKLGFKPMDTIKSVNGEPVNSPTKAMELYNSLKNDSRIQIQIERNGRVEDFSYNIAD